MGRDARKFPSPPFASSLDLHIYFAEIRWPMITFLILDLKKFHMYAVFCFLTDCDFILKSIRATKIVKIFVGWTFLSYETGDFPSSILATNYFRGMRFEKAEGLALHEREVTWAYGPSVRRKTCSCGSGYLGSNVRRPMLLDKICRQPLSTLGVYSSWVDIP